MSEIRAVHGRDVVVYIDGGRLLQANSAELKQIVTIHKVRSCFCGEDKAHIREKCEYKLILTGLRFLRPFENCNFGDLDDFEAVVEIDGTFYRLCHCMWDDYKFTVDKEAMREHISITALTLKTEKSEEKNEGN